MVIADRVGNKGRRALTPDLAATSVERNDLLRQVLRTSCWHDPQFIKDVRPSHPDAGARQRGRPGVVLTEAQNASGASVPQVFLEDVELAG